MTDKTDSQADTDPVVQTRYSGDELVSEVVIRALAVAQGIEPTELDPLYESIDSEALDALFGDPVIGDEAPTRIEFSVSEYRILVSSNGQIGIWDGMDGLSRGKF